MHLFNSVSPHAGDLREQLLKHAALKLIHSDECVLTLESVAALAHVEEADAKSLFKDGHDILEQLEEHVYSVLFDYADREKAKVPEDGPANDKLRALLTGYFRFSIEEPELFNTYLAFEGGACSTSNLTGLDALATRPFFNYILRHVQKVSESMDGPQDPATLMILASSVFGTVHGYAHLCAYGAARHLVDSAKLHTLKSMLDTLCVGVTPIFMGGVMRAITPTTPSEPLWYPASLGNKQLDMSTDDGKREAILRQGMRLLRTVGIENFDLRSAAAEVGISTSEAHRLFDGHRAYLDKLESIFEARLQGAINDQVQAAGAEERSIPGLKAAGFGALAAAQSNPAGVLGLIQVSSGTIVPTTRDADDQLDNSSVSFRTTFRALNEAFTKAGVEASVWDLYVMTFTAWAACHGIVHLTTLSAGATMDERLKFLIMGSVLDVAILSIVESNNMKIEPHTIVPFGIEERFEAFIGEKPSTS